MNELQYKEFGLIAQQCGGDDRRYRSINVASKVRRDAILAAWRELERLRDVNGELLAACDKALDGIFDFRPELENLTDGELRHPDNDCYAAEVILQIRAAIAKAGQTD